MYYCHILLCVVVDIVSLSCVKESKTMGKAQDSRKENKKKPAKSQKEKKLAKKAKKVEKKGIGGA